MAPSVRYATADAGTSLALTTVGDGVPTLFVPPVPFSHLEAGWQVPGVRRFFDLLGRHAEVALFDSRGTGLSDRDQADFSLETLAADIDAVARRLEWSRFAM